MAEIRKIVLLDGTKYEVAEGIFRGKTLHTIQSIIETTLEGE